MQAINAHNSTTGSIPIHRNRNMISILVGVIGFFMLWGFALAGSSQGGSATAFLNAPSVAVVVGIPLAILTAIFGGAGVIDAFCYLFRKPQSSRTAADAVTFFQLWAAFALACGFLASLVGLISMLSSIDDPSLIGPHMAFALLSQLYGVFVAVICIGLAAFIARRHHGAALASPVARQAAGVAGITLIAGTMTTLIAFCILMLSMTPSL
ncbi:MAG: MotA/TolQ/ExbB proton channel family protein [Phycisphaerales bacterium]|nr:MotA/TolQ/ExbB proton channel family protein [Phycisphaerales bacterium]